MPTCPAWSWLLMTVQRETVIEVMLKFDMHQTNGRETVGVKKLETMIGT